MKTTKLFIGALAVMSFAACQNEEMIAEQTSVQGRKQIDVKIVPTTDVDSRMINNNGVFSWENTDQLGAAMVDVTTVGTLTNSSHFGNAQFNYADGEFTTASTLSVGSYVFYYPYDADNTTSRGGVIVKTLGAQKFDATGEEMMKNNFMVAPVTYIAGAEAGELTLPMTFRSVYGYGNLTLTNNLDNGEEIEIQKIVISALDNDGNPAFVIGGKLAVAQFQNITDEEDPQDIGNLYVTINEDTDAREAYVKADSVYQNKVVDGVTVKPAAVKWVTGETGNVSLDCLNGTSGIKLAHGASVSTRVLIPAGEYLQNEFTIIVYTNKGVTTVGTDKITTSEEAADINAEKIVVRNGRTKTIGAEITADPTPAEGLNVISKADFIASMDQYKEHTTNLDVNVAAGVEIDAEMLAAIPEGLASVTFTNAVTVNATATLRKVIFEDAVTLKGNITLQPATGITMFNANNVTVKGVAKIASSIGASFDVEAGATLNVNAGVTLTGAITSKGTLNIGSTGGTAVSATSVDATSGTLNVNSALTTTGGLTMGSDEEGAKALTATIKAGVDGTVNVYKSATLTANVEKVSEANRLTITANSGSIVNNKSIAITTNTGTVTNNAGAELTVTTNNGTINNSGTATVGTNRGESTTTKATINQVAETAKVTVTSNLEYGFINTISGSTTTVATSNLNGEVVYVEGAKLAVNAEDGAVSYEVATITAADLTALAEAKPFINKVVITDAYTSNDAFTIPATIKYLVFKGDATFSKAFASTTAVAANASNTSKGRGEGVDLTFFGNVTLTEGASFPEGAVITFDGGKKLSGKSITVGRTAKSDDETLNQITAFLVWNILNGELTNECPVDATDDTFVVNFIEEDETNGITAGSIWNDRVIKATTVVYEIDGAESTLYAVANILWNGTAITDL